jgi:hypothetical protein
MLTKRINQLEAEQKRLLTFLLTLNGHNSKPALSRRYELKRDIKDLHNRIIELRKHLK